MAVIIDAVTAIAGTVPMESEVFRAGIIGNLGTQADRIERLIKAAVIVFAMAFVVYRAVVSKFAIGTILVSALAAGLFVWIVLEIDFLKEEIGEDIKQGTVTHTAPIVIETGTGTFI